MKEDASALLGGHVSPGTAVEGVARRADGQFDVFPRGLGHHVAIVSLLNGLTMVRVACPLTHSLLM